MMAGSLLSYTRALLVSEARRMLREKSAGRFEDADIERWADLGCLLVAQRTRCIKSFGYASAVSATAGYDVYAKALGSWAISRIDYGAVKLKGPIPWDRREEHLPQGMALTTVGTPTIWSPYGSKFYIAPVPANSGTVMKVWASEMPHSLSASGTTLSDIGMEEWTGPAVEAYMAYRGHLLDGSMQRAQAAYQLFERSIMLDRDTSVDNVAEEEARGS